MAFAGIDWDSLRRKASELVDILMSPSLDSSVRGATQKELTQISALLNKYDTFQALEKERAEIEIQLAQTADAELKMLFEEEQTSLVEKQARAQQALELVLFPPDPRDDRSVFLEIRAGAGGQEAALFAADLARMYSMYALAKGWHASMASESSTDLGGYREVVLHIQGPGVYGHLKFESGVHRVQRVPKTETQGRVHTSTVTIAVLPEAEEVEMSINPVDLRIDVFRAGGAGGQHVNKTESAVRITHLPTGLVVSCQDERSQHKNKAKALKVLQSRLLAQQREKSEAEASRQRKEQVGTGERAEKVRTYNFPQNRVTDHQVEVTLKKLDRFMEGDMDEIIQPLRDKERADRRKGFTWTS